jgi:hypothetical protein
VSTGTLTELIVGVTATRGGVNDVQRLSVAELLMLWLPREVHHGDCVGGDADVHTLVRDLGLGMRIAIHPPDVDTLRAFCQADVIHAPKPYLERNHDIVDDCQRLLALPAGEAETLRSGTWATVRYAQQVGVPVFVLFPSGQLELRENGERTTFTPT